MRVLTGLVDEYRCEDAVVRRVWVRCERGKLAVEVDRKIILSESRTFETRQQQVSTSFSGASRG